MNISNTSEVFLETNELTNVEKVIAAAIWLILEFICNPMALGMVQFERIGGDPLKRRITDQVFRKTNKYFRMRGSF